MTKPNYQYYVTATDRFMSGWGMSKGLINKLIFPCVDYQQAQIVYNYICTRREMKYVNICSRKPSYYRNQDQAVGNYYVQVKTVDDYPMWYGIKD